MRIDISAWGHKNILALHPSTLEITKDKEMTKSGTCIVGVGATMALADFGEEFKVLARNARSRVVTTLCVDGLEERITGCGDPRLTLQDPKDIVVRRSRYVCGRTLCVGADRAACDLSREMISALRNPAQRLVVSISVEEC